MGPAFHDDDEDDDPRPRQKAPASGASKHSDTPALDSFGSDITKAALEDRLDPIVGRDREIERLAQILSRRKKNNPVLIGDPGVGKSAIVEGLALRIVQESLSDIIRQTGSGFGYGIYRCGTKYRRAV